MKTWRDQAACDGFDTNIFMFGPPAEALKICGQCSVTEECRDYAVKRGLWGVWGGLTNHGRRKYRKEKDNTIVVSWR